MTRECSSNYEFWGKRFRLTRLQQHFAVIFTTGEGVLPISSIVGLPASIADVIVKSDDPRASEVILNFSGVCKIGVGPNPSITTRYFFIQIGIVCGVFRQPLYAVVTSRIFKAALPQYAFAHLGSVLVKVFGHFFARHRRAISKRLIPAGMQEFVGLNILTL